MCMRPLVHRRYPSRPRASCPALGQEQPWEERLEKGERKQVKKPPQPWPEGSPSQRTMGPSTHSRAGIPGCGISQVWSPQESFLGVRGGSQDGIPEGHTKALTLTHPICAHTPSWTWGGASDFTRGSRAPAALKTARSRDPREPMVLLSPRQHRGSQFLLHCAPAPGPHCREPWQADRLLTRRPTRSPETDRERKRERQPESLGKRGIPSAGTWIRKDHPQHKVGDSRR